VLFEADLLHLCAYHAYINLICSASCADDLRCVYTSSGGLNLIVGLWPIKRELLYSGGFYCLIGVNVDSFIVLKTFIMFMSLILVRTLTA
jgi:hypothetical protein